MNYSINHDVFKYFQKTKRNYLSNIIKKVNVLYMGPFYHSTY